MLSVNKRNLMLWYMTQRIVELYMDAQSREIYWFSKVGWNYIIELYIEITSEN